MTTVDDEELVDDGLASGQPKEKLTFPMLCTHNDWDNMRVKKRFMSLRCRECFMQFKMPTELVVKCFDFFHFSTCADGEQCPFFHIHKYKTRRKEVKHTFEATAAARQAMAKGIALGRVGDLLQETRPRNEDDRPNADGTPYEGAALDTPQLLRFMDSPTTPSQPVERQHSSAPRGLLAGMPSPWSPGNPPTLLEPPSVGSNGSDDFAPDIIKSWLRGNPQAQMLFKSNSLAKLHVPPSGSSEGVHPRQNFNYNPCAQSENESGLLTMLESMPPIERHRRRIILPNGEVKGVTPQPARDAARDGVAAIHLTESSLVRSCLELSGLSDINLIFESNQCSGHPSRAPCGEAPFATINTSDTQPRLRGPYNNSFKSNSRSNSTPPGQSSSGSASSGDKKACDKPSSGEGSSGSGSGSSGFATAKQSSGGSDNNTAQSQSTNACGGGGGAACGTPYAHRRYAGDGGPEARPPNAGSFPSQARGSDLESSNGWGGSSQRTTATAIVRPARQQFTPGACHQGCPSPQPQSAAVVSNTGPQQLVQLEPTYLFPHQQLLQAQPVHMQQVVRHVYPQYSSQYGPQYSQQYVVPQGHSVQYVAPPPPQQASVLMPVVFQQGAPTPPRGMSTMTMAPQYTHAQAPQYQQAYATTTTAPVLLSAW